MAFFGTAGSTSSAGLKPLEKDAELSNPPTDSVSSLSWSPQADYLAAGSWDNNVRIYEVNASGQSQGKALYAHQGPVLSVCWTKDGTKVISGGADNAARLLDLNANPNAAQQVAAHDMPIKAVKYVETPQGGILVTGSWDKTVKYWDLRTPNPIATVQLPERCYSLDVVYPLMVVGCAERHVQIFNLTNPTAPYKTMQSPLKWQTRAVACTPQADGFSIGSVEGRVAVQYVDDKEMARNFSFRCHRRDGATKDQSLVYAINDMAWHPTYGSLATAGADGTIHYWDCDARTRLKSFEAAPGSISACAFSNTGSLFAYAVSYDWSKGHGGAVPNHPNQVLLHIVKEAEAKKRGVKR